MADSATKSKDGPIVNDGEHELVSGLDVSAKSMDFEEPAESKLHRFRKEDVVSLQNEGHDELDMNDEGTVQGFANAEGTYLFVDFGEKGSHIVTEDELRRVA